MSDYFHYFEALTNTSGDSLIGYFFRALNGTDVAPIYADDSGTPIVSVSGRDNMSKTDAEGNVSFFITPGTYNIEIYGPDGTTFYKAIPNVPMTSTQGPPGPKGDPGSAGNVDPDLASLKAALTTDVARIYDHAVFKWTTGDYTGQADDTNIIESDNAALTVGAWVRQLAANIQASDGNTVQANLSKIAFNAAAAFVGSSQPSQGEGSIWRAGRHSYKEAASDATDQHVTNAAGVKFYVVPSSLGYDIEAFGADMTGATDSSAIVQAAADLFPNGGALIVPPGTLKLASAVTMPPRLHLIGAGSALTNITCAGDGFSWQGSATDTALTVIRGFTMTGAGRTTGAALTLAAGATLNRIQGMRISDVNVNGFNVAYQGRSCWHTNFIGCRSNNCSFGIRLEGQCVKVVIDGCELSSLGSVYNDGSMGIYVDQYTYSDSVARRPEDVVISKTLVYGYDRNIFVNRALTATISECDIDAALRVGIEGSTVDYGFSIDTNWIAVIHNASGTNAILIDALSAANTAQISIAKNRISATGTPAPSNSIQIIGVNRTGVISVKDNNVGMGAGLNAALYLNTASKVTVSDNNLTGLQYSVNSENGGGHSYDRNKLNGPIRRIGSRTADRFGTSNTGTAVTGYSGLVTIPASATSVTLNLVTDLGLAAAPVSAAPASLFAICHAYQYGLTAGLSGGRGVVWARYDGTGNVIVTVQNSSGSNSSDVWLDLFCI